MKGLLVDSNVILDVFLDDPEWADWSESVLAQHSVDTALCINSIVYTEVSVGFKKIEDFNAPDISRGGKHDIF